jgi:hypothetical protein
LHWITAGRHLLVNFDDLVVEDVGDLNLEVEDGRAALVADV